MIVYLHGFRASPASFKAQLLAARLTELGYADLWQCPQLPISPAKTGALIKALCNTYAPADLTLIGSSLGGYYATWFAEQFGCRAVLLNPATQPSHDAPRYLSEQVNEQMISDTACLPAYLDELTEFAMPNITRPERYYLIAATGDQVLDYRDMLTKYPKVRTTLIQGSNHGLSDFAEHVDEVLKFCGIACPSGRLKRVFQ